MNALEKAVACEMFINGLEQQKNQQNDIENEVTEYVQSIFVKELKKLRDEFSLEILGLFSDLHDRAHREDDDEEDAE